MARPLRTDFDGAFHHVMNRGANHQVVFLDDKDRRMFLSILGEASERFGLEFHAYCLMPNHYHLLVRSPNSQLSRAMKHIGQVYTQRFNRRHGRDGALFRGRFHSILVDNERYLDTVARYIHLNPVGKNSHDNPVIDSFEWSSFAAYEGRVRTPDWLTTTEVLRRFSDAVGYGTFVRTSTPSSGARQFYLDPFSQRCVLGNQDFANRAVRLSGTPDRRLRPGINPPNPD